MPAVDLSELPTPQIIETPDFEVILAEVKESMITAFPQTQQAAVRSAMALESEPLTVIAQAFALRELLLRQRINEGAAACMLSHSTGDDLDNLAANMNTARLVITPPRTPRRPSWKATQPCGCVHSLRLMASAWPVPPGRMNILPAVPAVRWRTHALPAPHRRKWWWRCCPRKATVRRPKHS